MATGTMSSDQVFAALRQAEARAAELQKANDAAEQQLKALEQQIAAAEAELARVQQELADTKALQAQVQDEVTSLSTVKSALTVELPTLYEQVDTLAHTLERKAVDFTMTVQAFKGDVVSATSKGKA
jgi:chromosome segregation ATPase